MKELGKYIEGMRARHPRLSRRRMALDAGLTETVIQQIVGKGAGASPSTLRAITDRWGEPEDYIQLLKLAGHPLPEIGIPDLELSLTPEQENAIREIVYYFDQMTTENKRRLVALAELLAKENEKAAP